MLRLDHLIHEAITQVQACSKRWLHLHHTQSSQVVDTTQEAQERATAAAEKLREERRAASQELVTLASLAVEGEGRERLRTLRIVLKVGRRVACLGWVMSSIVTYCAGTAAQPRISALQPSSS